MTMQGDSVRVTLIVTQTLEQLGIPYAVAGSLASYIRYSESCGSLKNHRALSPAVMDGMQRRNFIAG